MARLAVPGLLLWIEPGNPSRPSNTLPKLVEGNRLFMHQCSCVNHVLSQFVHDVLPLDSYGRELLGYHLRHGLNVLFESREEGIHFSVDAFANDFPFAIDFAQVELEIFFVRGGGKVTEDIHSDLSGRTT